MQQRKKGEVAAPDPERVQRQGAALVHPVVEHQLRPGVTDHEILAAAVELPPGGRSAVRNAHDPGRLGPDPLRVARESLVEPDVAPGRNRQGIAEPLVGQFVGNQPLRFPSRIQMVGAQDGQRLGLERNLEFVLCHHHGVLLERIRAEAVDEGPHHLRLAGQAPACCVGQGGRHCDVLGDAAWYRRGVQGQNIVPADLDGGEIRRHRLGLLVCPGFTAGAGLAGDQQTVANRPVACVRGDGDPVAGLVLRMVVAGKPGGGTVGLARHQHAVGKFFPAHLAPEAPAGRRIPLIPDVQREAVSRQQRRVRDDHQLFGPLAESPQPSAVQGDFDGAQSREVQDNGRRRPVRLGVQDGPPVQPVAGQFVVQFQFVSRDTVGVRAMPGDVGIRGARRFARPACIAGAGWCCKTHRLAFELRMAGAGADRVGATSAAEPVRPDLPRG
ncbi:hypothetical protein D9M72_387390 [compost metagenome]